MVGLLPRISHPPPRRSSPYGPAIHAFSKFIAAVNRTRQLLAIAGRGPGQAVEELGGIGCVLEGPGVAAQGDSGRPDRTVRCKHRSRLPTLKLKPQAAPVVAVKTWTRPTDAPLVWRASKVTSFSGNCTTRPASLSSRGADSIDTTWPSNTASVFQNAWQAEYGPMREQAVAGDAVTRTTAARRSATATARFITPLDTRVAVWVGARQHLTPNSAGS
jgi:hypothetical protein